MFEKLNLQGFLRKGLTCSTFISSGTDPLAMDAFITFASTGTICCNRFFNNYVGIGSSAHDLLGIPLTISVTSADVVLSSAAETGTLLKET